jgi:NADPH:quinone reductase-like Zn-dependent oxidoreductase
MVPPNAIIGFDLAGTVVALGEDLANTELKIGDRVAAMVLGGTIPGKGAFAGTSPHLRIL